MIENSMGFFSMPIGVVLNFIVNNKPVIIPLVVEEPSIIAACSGIAYLVGRSGGVYAKTSSSIMIGQINMLNIEKIYRAKLIININKTNIKKIINDVSKNMVKRGGGCQYLTCKVIYISKGTIHTQYDSKKPSLVIHFYVNCCDAMGANIVNTILENITYKIKNLLKCDFGIRIISNFSTKRMAKAYCSIPYSDLSNRLNESHGIWIAKNMISAYRMSVRDVYRACTHNKGIMNGIDAVAIATGNDWRALESAAHTFASRGNMYTSLTIYVMCKDFFGMLY
jgi:hydroxymethylglutaryl-CoA reductase